jgi:hypothetical protein
MTTLNEFLDLMVQARKATNRKDAIDLINRATRLRENHKIDVCISCGTEFFGLEVQRMKQPCCYCRNQAFYEKTQQLDSTSPLHQFQLNELRKEL